MPLSNSFSLRSGHVMALPIRQKRELFRFFIDLPCRSRLDFRLFQPIFDPPQSGAQRFLLDVRLLQTELRIALCLILRKDYSILGSMATAQLPLLRCIVKKMHI